MKHFVYKTTCTITGRYYLGVHSTTNEDDGYLGSGKYLHRSIKKHGAHNHTREVLRYFETRTEAELFEAEVVTWDLIHQDAMCMNLAPGGSGGDRLSQHPDKELIVAKINRKGEANGMHGKRHTDKTKLLISQKRAGTTSWNKGQERTDAEIKAISEGTRKAMSKPEVREKFLAAVRDSAKRNTGKITIWLNGSKKILWPEDYTQELKEAGWVRSKAKSMA